MPTLKIAYYSGMGRYLLNKYNKNQTSGVALQELLECLTNLIKAIEEITLEGARVLDNGN